MNKQHLRYFFPAIILFILFNAAFLFLRDKLTGWGFDMNLLIAGNIIIFLGTLFSYYMNLKGLLSKTTGSFLRFVYGGFMMKIFLMAIIAFIYILVAGDAVNKPGIFFCMGLYLLYTFIEVVAVQKVTQKKTDA